MEKNMDNEMGTGMMRGTQNSGARRVCYKTLVLSVMISLRDYETSPG